MDIIVDHYHCEEQAVHAVQHTAVTRDEAAAILNTHLALHHGHGEITEGEKGRDESAQDEAVNKVQTYDDEANHKRDRYSANPASYGSFPGLLGAQPGEELVTPQG